MKFSYSNYSTLKLLKEKRIDKFKVSQADLLSLNNHPKMIMGKVFEHFNFYLKSFSENIFFISEGFYDAFTNSADKMLDLFQDIVKNNLSDFSIKATYIIRDSVWMVNLDKKENEDFMNVGIYIFDKEQNLKTILISNTKDDNLIKKFFWDSLKKTESNTNIDDDMWTYVTSISVLHMFQRYAEIETKFLLPKTKSTNIKCFYNNQTDLKIIRLDCSWFTNLIHSEGFKVSGHFRLQPYADGSKKLIWINEFKKMGYKRKASMLK